MISGLPTEQDLEAAGLDYLYMAFEGAQSVVEGEQIFVEYQEEGAGFFEEGLDLVGEYWNSAQRQLAKCASLLQMGTELLLKAKIASVSPFLLLDSAASWPAMAGNRVHFDEFRTVGAQVLPRIFNTVCPRPLPVDFCRRVEKIRKRRNAIVHAGSGRAVPKAGEIIRDLLEVVTVMKGEGQWPTIHREQIESSPISHVDWHNSLIHATHAEIGFLVRELKPAEVARHLGINKRQRLYFCPVDSSGDLFSESKMALLRPNTPRSVDLYCLACDRTHPVDRAHCDECQGNVLVEGECMSCSERLE